MQKEPNISSGCREQSDDDFEEIEVELNRGIGSSVSQMFNSINQMYSSSIRSISEMATNLAYNAKHSSCPFVQRKLICLKPDSDPIYLLGKKYGPEDKQQFEQAFHSIIWICYRSELEGQFGDVGWGCMIRVCQMVLAEALKRCSPHKHNSQIIKQFCSSPTALFSFDKICMEGKIMNRWTSSTQIIIALQDLLKEQLKFKLKIQMYNGQVSIDDIENETEYPMLIIVNNRLGSNKIEDKLKDHLNFILQHKNSIGMISGIGGEAIYVAGYHEDQLIALDPHYVQSQIQGQKSYSNLAARGVPFQRIVPSVGFCLYFNNPQDHKQWILDLAESCHFQSPNVVIQCDPEFCKNVYTQRHPKVNNKQSQDQFQILQ